MQPIMLILHKFSSVPLKQAPVDSWKAIAIGKVSDMPIVKGDESREEHNEIGVMRKSLDNELILSALDIPLEDMLEANDLDRGLYTENELPPMIEVEETLLESEELDIEKAFSDDSVLLAFGGSVRTFKSILVEMVEFVVLVSDAVTDSVVVEGTRNKSLNAAYRSLADVVLGFD